MQVRLDGLRTDEQRRARFLVRRALRHEQCELKLVRSELVNAARISPTCLLPAGGELRSGPRGPGTCAKPIEDMERCLEVRAGLPPPPSPPEPLAVAELGARPLESARRRVVQDQRLLECVGKGRLSGDQSATTGRR